MFKDKKGKSEKVSEKASTVVEAFSGSGTVSGAGESSRRKARKRWVIGAAALLACSAALAAWLLLVPSKPAEVFDGLPHRYTYAEAETDGLPKLHMIAVAPENIELRADKLTLRQIPAYGINGGFFYEDTLLSIAVMDDKPVNGKRGDYGSGWFNAKYARGTLVWDGAAKKFSVQVVSSADELRVSDRGNYFAQGGVSLNLADDAGWEKQSAREHLPFAEDRRMRSGLVYNDAGQLWLIVAPEPITAAEFRSALLAGVPGEGREGIFLDGDGSSQMNADEAVLTGDGRMVVQMIGVSSANQ
ncbi:phosphodiester glycosidase family protein [Saccharibacillus endophyticus]|uniref:Phosphodiester glycosidase domain-containing protein n=1 Tax=Saccharibacillus endophyticus TaxID=2060666 RepID=A0ABQ2A633_9BACL|nr:phosphodiester glycosidase family protein [Saccharibacillus endophyticus]GGH84709.1 hypothetical protein GCM10007362_40410 [Saccharibacillus endophyticus]